MIEGPPETGKTRTIAAFLACRTTISKHERIMICAPRNVQFESWWNILLMQSDSLQDDKSEVSPLPLVHIETERVLDASCLCAKPPKGNYPRVRRCHGWEPKHNPDFLEPLLTQNFSIRLFSCQNTPLPLVLLRTAIYKLLGPEKIVIDIAGQKAYIGSCDAFAPVTAHQRGSFLRKPVHVEKTFVIPPRSERLVPTRPLALPEDRDFLFDPSVQGNLTMYAYLVDHGISVICRICYYPLHAEDSLLSLL